MTTNDGNAALAKLLAVLNQKQISYMLVGSYSSNAYGIPRATKDADLVVQALGEMFEEIAGDVVVQKLRWGRPQDISDVNSVLAVQNEALDWSYIEHWTNQHGTTELLNQLRSYL